jgi:hypothetical protein
MLVAAFGSPPGRTDQRGGRFLMLGALLRTCTMMHGPEEMLIPGRCTGWVDCQILAPAGTRTVGVAPASAPAARHARVGFHTVSEIRSGRMDSHAFEKLIASLLWKLGSKEVKIVPRQQDEGADVVATFNIANTFPFVLAVQAEHY